MGSGIDKRALDLSVYDVLLENATVAETRQASPKGGFDVVGANRELAGAEIELVGLDRRDKRLRAALGAAAADYDFVLVDCPPSLSLLTLNGLASAHGVIVPMQCEYFALEGLSDLVNTIKQVHANLNPGLEVIGILRVMFDARITLAGAGERAAQDALRRQGVRHRRSRATSASPKRRATACPASSSIRLRRARSPFSTSRARWWRAQTSGTRRLCNEHAEPRRRRRSTTRCWRGSRMPASTPARRASSAGSTAGWCASRPARPSGRAASRRSRREGSESTRSWRSACRSSPLPDCARTCASRPSPSPPASIAHLAARGMERIDDTRVMVVASLDAVCRAATSPLRRTPPRSRAPTPSAFAEWVGLARGSSPSERQRARRADRRRAGAAPRRSGARRRRRRSWPAPRS